MKVLILGHNGMLGSMIQKYFSLKNVNIVTTNLRYPNEDFFNFIKEFDGDVIINCIGSIPQRTSEFKINTDLPLWLCNNTNCKIIYPSTDCESDNNGYGISKKIASEYIKLYCKKTKIIKTSIIGYEKGTNYSLLEWFLSQKTSVEGYTGAIWNGITTLEWAKHAFALIHSWDTSEKVITLTSEKVSKYKLLNLFSEVHDKSITIIPVQKGHDRSLSDGIQLKQIKDQLIEMKAFCSR